MLHTCHEFLQARQSSIIKFNNKIFIFNTLNIVFTELKHNFQHIKHNCKYYSEKIVILYMMCFPTA